MPKKTWAVCPAQDGATPLSVYMRIKPDNAYMENAWCTAGAQWWVDSLRTPGFTRWWQANLRLHCVQLSPWVIWFNPQNNSVWYGKNDATSIQMRKLSLRKITQLKSSQVLSDAKSLDSIWMLLEFLSSRELPTFYKNFFSDTPSLCLNISGDRKLTTHQLLVESSNFQRF